MHAAVLRGGRLQVDDVPAPEPGPGQVLVRTLACGICGSDLHAVAHGEQLVEQMSEAADLGNDLGLAAEVMDLGRDVVIGHEFSAEVVGVGEGTTLCTIGDVVVSLPVAVDAGGIHPIGFANAYPGGYGELMVLNDLICLKVPNGLEARLAALTEPMAVGVHAVNRAAVRAGDTAVVLGCGPVGLAVIAALRLAGVETIVAADFSPTRRSLATTMGASAAVDPHDEPAVDAWRRIDGSSPLVIFEAVGVAGMLDQAMRAAPRNARILVVGVCMTADTIQPMRGVVRELDIRFALGYDLEEFSGTLRRIAEGELDVTPLVTGSVGIDGVPGAFADLADPDAHAKILIEP